jgi:uncharacterized protein YcaQ
MATLVSPGPRTQDAISATEARALVLTAQGFAPGRGSRVPSALDVRAVIERLGLLQLDSVSVFCRSHYMPIFARLGPYECEILDRIAAHDGDGTGRELIEYWGHEASLMTPEIYPLLRWRMGRADLEAWKFVVAVAREQPQLITETLALVASDGPIRGSQTGHHRPEGRDGEMWNRHDGKNALEYLFYSGQVVVAQRANFQRLYDLPERVLPEELLAAPRIPEAEAQRRLILFAARALGVAAESDLGDYFRMTRSDSKRRVAELVEADDLQAVTVEGWPVPGYLPAAVRSVLPVQARALLSPFDSLIWTRDRTRRLFGFDYHIEIYTPALKRQYGYYVLPFLLGDELVARVDLKSDRKARTLIVQAAFAEPGADAGSVAAELASELQAVARWLDLDGLQVNRKGDLAAPLSAALG